MKFFHYILSLFWGISLTAAPEINLIDIISLNTERRLNADEYAGIILPSNNSYESLKEINDDFTIPHEHPLLNLKQTSVPQNTSIANSVFLPLLFMFAGLILWRIHFIIKKKFVKIDAEKND